MNGPRFFPEALGEDEDAVAYYETREEGLGARLVEEDDEAIAFAMEFPSASAMVREAPVQYGLRSVLIKSFPINFVCVVRNDTLVVVALFHARRHPGYWMERLRRV